MAAEPVPRISVAVFNYSAVSPETLARVEREAGNILLSLGGLGAQLQESGSGAESTITVRVHNDAEVSAGTIRSALREAKRIFGGIRRSSSVPARTGASQLSRAHSTGSGVPGA